MSYESWRATFQSSEQAARAAYQELQAARAQGDCWIPSLEWAVKRCEALQAQGFYRVRLDVLELEFKNAIEAHRPQTAQREVE